MTFSGYFAYGSNLSRSRLEARIGPCEVAGQAWLDGHELRFHKRGRDGSGKCDVHATGQHGHRVHGVVYLLEAGQQRVLDGIEGSGYRRVSVTVGGPAGSPWAWTYVARTKAIAGDLSPFDWYKAYVVGGALEHGLPRSYVAALEAVACMEDAGARGAAPAGRAPGPHEPGREARKSP